LGERGEKRREGGKEENQLSMYITLAYKWRGAFNHVYYCNSWHKENEGKGGGE
jgi:hypothetical protein